MRVTPRFWLCLPLLLALALLPAPLPAQGHFIDIRKTAGQENPGLHLAEFSGSPATKARLEATLRRCGWFTILPSPRGASYILTAVESGPALELTVTAAGGATFSLRQPARSRQPEWTLYQAVDQLIERLFKVPGPCASTIAFVNGKGGYKEIVTCHFDGSGIQQLTFSRSIATEPSWGPRGSLVYTLYQNNYTDVVLVDTLSRQQRRLSAFPGLNSSADLAPDGRFVALTLSRDRKVELYGMDVRTRGLRRLTHDAAVESSPCWSPDGARICYVSDLPRSPKLYVIPAGGGRAQRLCSLGGEQVSPDWSAVANKICFATGSGGNYDLAVIAMDTPGQMAEVLTRGGVYEAPSWAPDGRHVACTKRAAGGRRQLVMFDTWLKRETPITAPGDLSLPSWSPAHD
ncbi:MAG: hypothetical protein WC789_04845 [Lentisphaeria bacterium]|jgi:TolB protein